jgi:hypothetical protein
MDTLTTRWLADRAAVADIGSYCVQVRAEAGVVHYDARPWLDSREHSDQAIDAAREVIQYSLDRGLATVVVRHADGPVLMLTAKGEALK